MPTTAASIPQGNSFARDVLKLVSGTAVAQLLGILASPILTRLYTPDAFGVLAIFTSIVSILGVVACLRYELSIMLPDSDEEAANLFAVSLSFAVLVSLLTVPLVWWGREPLLRWLNAPQLGPYLSLVPPAVLVAGVILALNYWNTRTKQFGRLSIARVSGSVATTSTNLGFGFLGNATSGVLIAASFGGQVVNATILAIHSWRDNSRLFLHSISWQKMLAGISRYRKFPLFGTWSALLNTISWQLPAFLLAAFFSSSVVGFYALGFRILQMPMRLIGAAIGQVFFQQAAQAKVQGTLAELVEATFRRLVMVGLFPMLMLTIIGRDLYVVIFGQNWAEAGVYTQILGVWAFFWFISSPMSTLFSILEKQEIRPQTQCGSIYHAPRFFDFGRISWQCAHSCSTVCHNGCTSLRLSQLPDYGGSRSFMAGNLDDSWNRFYLLRSIWCPRGNATYLRHGRLARAVCRRHVMRPLHVASALAAAWPV